MQKRKIKPVVKQSKDSVINFDYKDPSTMIKFVTEQGRILPRTRSGLTAKQQRALAKAIKRARTLALMPFAN